MNDIALVSGRDLDSLVAEKVLGKICMCVEGGMAAVACPIHDGPYYSTDIKAAWELVEKVGLFRNCRHLYEEGVGDQRGKTWTRTGWRWVVVMVLEPLDQNEIIGFGNTAEQAICRAAIRVAEELKAAEESA
jgi:ABA sandwich protein